MGMEKSYGRFNFEQADVAMFGKAVCRMRAAVHRLMRRCKGEKGHDAMPAYDYCLKASHAFNLLDARGAIQQNARPNYILRVRKLAHACCAVWLGEKRQDLRRAA